MDNDLNAVINKLGYGKFSFKMTLLLGSWWMVDSIELTLLSLVTPTIKCKFNLSSFQAAFTSSVVFIGMGIGTFYWGWLADRIGRKKSFVAAAFFAFYFANLSSFSNSYALLVSSQFIVGICVGGITLSPLYVIEYFPSKYRGRIVIFLQFFFTLGNVYTTLMAYLTLNKYGYKMFLLATAIPIPFVCLASTWLPESIHYLQNTQSYDEIKSILTWVSLENKVELPKNIIIECEKTVSQGSIKKIFSKKYRWITIRLMILWSVSVCLYFGTILINTEIYLVPSPCESSSYIPALKKTCYKLNGYEYLSTAVVVIGEVPGIALYYFLIDRIGRKKCIMLSHAVNLFGFIMILFCIPIIARTIVLTVMRAFSASLTNVLFAYSLEIYPTSIRSTGVGLCQTCARWALAFVPFLVQSLLHTSFYAVLLVFSGFCIIGVITTYTLEKDTTGIDLKRE